MNFEFAVLVFIERPSCFAQIQVDVDPGFSFRVVVAVRELLVFFLCPGDLRAQGCELGLQLLIILLLCSQRCILRREFLGKFRGLVGSTWLYGRRRNTLFRCRAEELPVERERWARSVRWIPGVVERQPDADVEQFPKCLLRMLDGDGSIGVNGAVCDLTN